MPDSASQPGTVYLVGAGPGDPGLITMRGILCLRKADVVLCDYLANPQLLRYCRPEAEKISLGKHGSGRIWSQEEINAALVRLAREGKTVVRLKSGDPVVFVDGAPASGLTFNYAASVRYSNQPGGGPPYTYTPVPNAAGFDPNVTGFRIAPTGMMNAATVAGNPSFTIRFRVRVR